MVTYTQTTLAREVVVSGTGLHTGTDVRMVMQPAPAETGIVFHTQDGTIPCSVAHASPDAARNTTLRRGEASLHTVEHVLAALSGLGIDNAVVALGRAAEPPVMDGSALPLCHALREAGVRALEASSRFFEVSRPLFVEDPGRAAAAVLPHDGFRITVLIGYDHPLVRTQSFDAELTEQSFLDQVAPARTYGFIEEVETLRKAGLALGGNEDNAVVIYPDRFSTDLRMENELAAHKALDMIGDLALLGRRVRGHFIGYRSGHALNARLVRAIMASAAQG